MTEAWFYHLQGRSLEQVLPTLLERSLARGWNAVVELSSAERLAAVDERLWTYADESFLPHAPASEPDAGASPVVLALGPENPNGAQIRFCVDGVRIPDALDGYDRVILIFDGDDPEALASAREDWKRMRALGVAATYWQQDETGRWEKKA